MLTRFRSLASKAFRYAFASEKLKALQPAGKYNEKISKARTVFQIYDLALKTISPDNFIAPDATVCGEVILGREIVIWGGTVIRGDINVVLITSQVVIGENCVLWTAPSVPSGLPAELSIGRYTAIQPGCTLYSCNIGNEVHIGANSVILEGAVLENGCVIAPGSVVPPGRVVPGRQVWGGNPIKYIRDVEDRDVQALKTFIIDEVSRADFYRGQFLPHNNAYLLKQNGGPQDEIIEYDSADSQKNILERPYNPNRID